jgi:hypothetical protein
MKRLQTLNHNALRKGIIMRQFITITTADNTKFYVVDLKSEKLGKQRGKAKMFNKTPATDRHIAAIAGWAGVKELGQVTIAAGQDEVESAPVAKVQKDAPVAKRKYTKRAVVEDTKASEPEQKVDRRLMKGLHKSIVKLSVAELITLHGRLTKVLGSIIGSATIKVRKPRAVKVIKTEAAAPAVPAAV